MLSMEQLYNRLGWKRLFSDSEGVKLSKKRFF